MPVVPEWKQPDSLLTLEFPTSVESVESFGAKLQALHMLVVQCRRICRQRRTSCICDMYIGMAERDVHVW